MNFLNITVFSLFLVMVQVTFGNVIKELKSEFPWKSIEIENSKDSTVFGASLHIQTKIVNGTDAAPYEFPYQVEIKADGKHHCGGTLLNKDYILTAAHCFNDHAIGSYEVVAGEHNIVKDEGPEQVRRIKKIILHESYDRHDKPPVNDIALVLLDHSLALTPEVQPLTLPEPNYDATGKLGVVSGWGHNETDGSLSDVLQKVTLPIISNAACNLEWSDGESDEGLIPQTALCAFQLGKDSCQGDSGGPLALQLDNGTYILVGIVSFGGDCADPHLPGVYTRVSQYIQWIEYHVQCL